MPYDTYINRKTGDWVLSANGDFQGATGVEFDRQRIWIRAVIPRGTFVYDKTKTLGSTLYEVPRNPPFNLLEVARNALYTALDGIDGISIDDIDVVQVGSQISLLVQFSKTNEEITGTFLFDLASAEAEGTEFASGN